MLLSSSNVCLSSGVAFGLIVSVLFCGPSGVISNVGIAVIVIVVELGKDALFRGVLRARRKIIHSV
jgi:hypothetical protein